MKRKVLEFGAHVSIHQVTWKLSDEKISNLENIFGKCLTDKSEKDYPRYFDEDGKIILKNEDLIQKRLVTDIGRTIEYNKTFNCYKVTSNGLILFGHNTYSENLEYFRFPDASKLFINKKGVEFSTLEFTGRYLIIEDELTSYLDENGYWKG